MGEEDELKAFLKSASSDEKKRTRDRWYSGDEFVKKLAGEELRCQFSTKITPKDEKVPPYFERCTEELKQSTKTGFYRCDVCCLYGHTDIAPYFVHGDVKANEEGVAAHSFEVCLTW